MTNTRNLPLIILIIALLSFITSAKAEIKVVTSIKPIHSLVSYVMDGVGTPDLIVDGFNSPHNFQLKPSHAKMLENADIIFWIGEGLENFLEKPLDSISKNAKKVELMEIKGINKLEFREKNIFNEHDHDKHEEDGHKEEKHDEHEHEEDGHKEEKHDDHDDHDDHGHGAHDPHIWLDPQNAKVIVKLITKELSELDSKNAPTYKKNSEKALSDLDKLIKKVKKDTSKDLRFVVFHDAYHYYEDRFGINLLGALTVNPDVLPGAAQLVEIREVIEHEKVNCIFSEPQFNPDIIKSIAKDPGVKTGVLDPLGANLDKGKNLYFDLIKNISSSFKGC
jgi:zinc transport system substrate-binding protein